MSNELVSFTETAVQAAFNWNEAFAETKELVKEDAELTATIDDAMVRRFHGRVKIGLNLMALQSEHAKDGHGDFTTVELPKLGITDRTFAYRCINVAKLFQKLGGNSSVASLQQTEIFDLPMPLDTWNRLASPSGQTVVHQLESGEIKPTQASITKALEEERARLAKERQRAKELEDRLESERKAHSIFREDVALREQKVEQKYTLQVQALKQQVKELEEKPEPEPQKVYEDTPDTKTKLASLQAKLVSLEERQAKLKEEVKKKEEMFQQTRDANIKIAEENKKLSEEAKRRWIEGQIELDQLRVRQEWRKAVEKFLEDTAGFMARVPALIDREAFESDDWSRYGQCIHVVEQALALLKSIQTSQSNQFVDASSVVELPITYIEAGRP